MQNVTGLLPAVCGVYGSVIGDPNAEPQVITTAGMPGKTKGAGEAEPGDLPVPFQTQPTRIGGVWHGVFTHMEDYTPSVMMGDFFMRVRAGRG